MTYTAHDPRVFYAAVKARLETTGKNIGDGEAPSDLTVPYAVLYSLDEPADPDRNGTLADAHATTVFEFQVTSIGDTAEQARWMQQKTRSVLVGWSPVVSGLSCGPAARSGGQGVRRDDGTQPARFFAVDTFTVFAA